MLPELLTFIPRDVERAAYRAYTGRELPDNLAPGYRAQTIINVLKLYALSHQLRSEADNL